MILSNFIKAKLYQYNRGTNNSYYDDEDINIIDIKLCPYSSDSKVAFGTYTHPEATGYYIVKANIDIRKGDQIEFNGEKHTILEIKDNWIWNKVVNLTIVVK